MIKKYVQDIKKEYTGYNIEKLMKDILAGITVAAVALPLALAFGISCGADAAAGLVTAIVGGFIMCVFSGTSFQISGPTGAMTAVLVTVIAKYSLQGMFITCLIAGVILLFCGLFRLGSFVNFIPIPVITGFTSGIALVIAFGQIDNFFGTKSVGELTIQKLLSYGTLGFHINLANMLVGVAVIAVMLIWPSNWNQKVPGSLIAIILATIVVSVFHIDIPTVGEIPKSILLSNRLNLSEFSVFDLSAFISPAFSVAILAMIESLLCASSASRMKKESYDPDRELVAQGIGNIMLPFFGGVPATSAIARTSVGIKSGGQTRMTGIVHSLVLFLCVFLISSALKNLPLAALSGVLIITAYRMNDWEIIQQYFQKKMKGPILKYLATMIATVVFDLTLAIVLGIVIALIVFVVNISNIEVTSSKIENDKLHTKKQDIEDSCKNAVVVYITGPMFFMNSQKLIHKLKTIHGYETIILSVRGVPLVDVSAISMLSDYYDTCVQSGVDLFFCGVQDKVLKKLQTCEFYDRIGKEHFYFSVDRVISRLCYSN